MNQALYNDVWQQLLDAERCYRYYNDLADRYRKRHKIPRWIMAVSSVVGVISIFTQDLVGFADLLYVPAFLLILAVAVWDLLHDDGEKAAILDFIGAECAELETELKDLWRSVYTELSIDEVQVNSRLREIERKLDRVSSRSAFFGIPVDEKLNEKSQKEGFKVISDRYANVPAVTIKPSEYGQCHKALQKKIKKWVESNLDEDPDKVVKLFSKKFGKENLPMLDDAIDSILFGGKKGRNKSVDDMLDSVDTHNAWGDYDFDDY